MRNEWNRLIFIVHVVISEIKCSEKKFLKKEKEKTSYRIIKLFPLFYTNRMFVGVCVNQIFQCFSISEFDVDTFICLFNVRSGLCFEHWKHCFIWHFSMHFRILHYNNLPFVDFLFRDSDHFLFFSLESFSKSILCIDFLFTHFLLVSVCLFVCLFASINTHTHTRRPRRINNRIECRVDFFLFFFTCKCFANSHSCVCWHIRSKFEDRLQARDLSTFS